MLIVKPVTPTSSAVLEPAVESGRSALGRSATPFSVRVIDCFAYSIFKGA